MSLTKTVLKFAAPLPRIEEFERYLFIGPHPDDIEIGAGATAAKLASQGKKICFLICTDGRFGDGNAPAGITGEKLVMMRRYEAVRSAEVLGIKDVRFLDLHDGGRYTKEELIRGIASVTGEFKPDIIFAPDPFVASECHADHLSVGECARQIACFAPYPGIMDAYGAGSAAVKALAFYMTAKPNRFIATKGYVGKQLSSVFDIHKSQFPDNSEDAKAISMYLKLRAVDNGIRSLKGCAEGFRVLGTTHMHCLPEAGE